MLSFSKLTLDDRHWAKEILMQSGLNGCEYTFGCAIVWNGYYKTYAAHFEDFIIYRYSEEQNRYAFPAGKGDIKKAIDQIIEDAQRSGKAFSIRGITERELPVFEKYYRDKFTFTETPESFDYIYNQSDLMNLSGKKYHSKRNHISSFLRTYENWSYEEITEQNISECKEMLDCWYKENIDENSESLKEERLALFKGLEIFFSVPFVGGFLRIDNNIVALTFGEALNDKNFVVHFEKALDIKGAYAMINREFVSHSLQGYEYINREEDLGIEGIRKAKLSYHPAIILKKYEARLKP